jgi:ATP synthase protein I
LNTSSSSLATASGSPQGLHQAAAAQAQPWDEEAAPQWPRALTREQVVALGLDRPSVLPRQVLAWQALAGVGFAAVLAVLSGQAAWAWSALYGCVAVVLPAAVFARGLRGRLASINPASAAMGFLVWEFVKLGLSLALLLSAPVLVEDLSWPALLAGLVVTMKVVWLAVWVQSRRPRTARAS